MKRWVALGAAIATEVTANIAIRAAQDAPGWYGVVAAGYVAAFLSFCACVHLGVNVRLALGIRWGSVVVLTLLVATAVYDEVLTIAIGLWAALVIVGAVAVQLGSRRRRRRRQQGDQPNVALLIRAAITELASSSPSHTAEAITKKLWVAPIAAGYLVTVVTVILAVRQGFALGVSYGAWAAAGVVLSSVASMLSFRQAPNRTTTLGILILVSALIAVVAAVAID